MENRNNGKISLKSRVAQTWAFVMIQFMLQRDGVVILTTLDHIRPKTSTSSQNGHWLRRPSLSLLPFVQSSEVVSSSHSPILFQSFKDKR